MTKRERLQFLAVWLLLGLLPLFIRPLWEPDETRYAEIPREMLASGDWLAPRLQGLLYFEKPPLQYWLSAVAMKLFGVNAVAARLPLALASALAMWAAWRLAWRMGARRPIWAAVMAAASLLGFVTAQLLTLDALFSAFLVVSLAAAVEAVTARAEERPAAGWTLLAFGALAAAMLTKGLAGPVLIGGVLLFSIPAAWKDARLRRAVLWTGFDPFGWALFAGLAGPWFWLVDRAYPGHAAYFFIHEHFARFSTNVHHRQGSENPVLDKFYFIGILMVGLLPWLSMGFLGLKRGFAFFRRARGPVLEGSALRRWTVAAVWWAALWPLIFFSLSGSKLPPYVLPCIVPIMALACVFEQEGEEARSLRRVAAELLLLAAILLAGAWVYRTELAGISWIVATGLAFAALGAWALRPVGLDANRWIAALAGCFLLLVLAGDKAVSLDKDPGPMVRLAPARAQWISYGMHFHGLPFHARQRVAVVAGTGELADGRRRAPEAERERWIPEHAEDLLPLALRMRAEDPTRPVLLLAKERDWDQAPAEARAAFRELQRRHGMVIAKLGS
ncbi:MAG: glycosyltransferase family 39 protein [Holophagaceae bacterium]|nr:glycosyltransferase family 39 protein [Holophagaceae bacterium]